MIEQIRRSKYAKLVNLVLSVFILLGASYVPALTLHPAL